MKNIIKLRDDFDISDEDFEKQTNQFDKELDLWFENHSSIRIITYSPYLPPLSSNAVLECWSINQKSLDLSRLKPYVEIKTV